MSDAMMAVVLAAGLGTRMGSARPKALQTIGGRALVGHVAATLAELAPARIVVVVGPGMDAVVQAAAEAAPGCDIVAAIQAERRGTGHAVMQARTALAGFAGDVVSLFADVPLIRAATIRDLVARRRAGGHALAVLGMRPADPLLYGRLILDAAGNLERIVEARDATPAERAIGLCNSGAMAFDGAVLPALLHGLKPANAQNEYYLTDTVALARAAGLTCAAAEAPADEVIGCDTRATLAAAEAAFQHRRREAALAAGVTLTDPATVWFSFDTVIGRDASIAPCVVFGPGVTVGEGATIGPFNRLEGIAVPPGATVPPHALAVR